MVACLVFRGSVNKVVQSFRELMLQDKVKQSDTAGRSVAQSPPSSTSTRPSASTTSAKPLLPSSRSPAQDLNIRSVVDMFSDKFPEVSDFSDAHFNLGHQPSGEKT